MTSYRDLQQYVESLSQVLEVKQNFKDLTHHHNVEDGKDYLLLTTIIGQACMFDITGCSKAHIFHIIAEVDCKIKPKELIEDKERLLALGRKFNK